MNGEPGSESMKNSRLLHIKMKLTLYFLRNETQGSLLDKKKCKLCGVEPWVIEKEHTLYLKVFDLQSVHVQAQDITGSSEAIIRFNKVAELGLGEELLLCQGPAGMKRYSIPRGNAYAATDGKRTNSTHNITKKCNRIKQWFLWV